MHSKVLARVDSVKAGSHARGCGCYAVCEATRDGTPLPDFKDYYPAQKEGVYLALERAEAGSA